MYKYKFIWRFLPTVVFAVLFLICSGNLYSNISEYRKGAESYLRLREHISGVMPDEPDISPMIVQMNNQQTEPPSGIVLPKVDFEALREINPDVEAWLILEDTAINYPVVRGGDNEYYLTHMADGTPNKSGCLFIDSGNRPGFSDRNTIIYGHNMKDGSMFGALADYREQAYYDAHPRMLLLTPEGNYTLELLAGYVCSGESVAWMRNFTDAAEFERWLSEAASKSLFTSGHSISDYERTVTLSTCAYSYQNAFFVLIGGLAPQ